MSSLINSASPWTSNDNPKKRISTMRKTIKKPRPVENDENVEISQEPAINNIEEMQNIANERNDRVNELINQSIVNSLINCVVDCCNYVD